MGGVNSKKKEYNSLTPDEQLQILEDFKITYSDKYIIKLPLTTQNVYESRKTHVEYHIYSNKYDIKFKLEKELIDFVYKIGRAFMIINDENVYSIVFVYTPNTDIENK